MKAVQSGALMAETKAVPKVVVMVAMTVASMVEKKAARLVEKKVVLRADW